MNQLNLVSTEDAPLPNGHYSQAVVANGLIFLSAQLGTIPGSTPRLPDSLSEQAEQCIKNIEAILIAAGSDLNHIVRCTIYVSDIKHWEEVNEVYTKKMGSHKPARAVIAATALHLGAKVAIDAIAIATE